MAQMTQNSICCLRSVDSLQNDRIFIFGWTISLSLKGNSSSKNENVDTLKFKVSFRGRPIIGADIKHFTIIDIGYFQNRFADYYFFYYYYFFIMQTNILFTGDIIYWWINNTGEMI